MLQRWAMIPGYLAVLGQVFEEDFKNGLLSTITDLMSNDLRI